MSSTLVVEPAERDTKAQDSNTDEPPGQRSISDSRRRMRGRILLLFSAVAFASMGLAVRVVPAPISSYEKVFYRSLIGTVLLLFFFIGSREPVGRPTNWLGLACRGLFGATSLLCFFYSIDHVGLSKATLYCYMYPIYAAVFAWWDLGEKPTPAALLALLLAVLGAIMTLDSHGMSLSLTRGDAAGIFAGIMSGAAVTSIRRLTRTERSAWIVLSFTLCSTLVAIPFIKQGHVTASLSVIGSLLAVGVSAIAAQVLLTKGLKYVNAVEGGVLSLTTVPLSSGLAFLVLQENIRLRFCLGAALILVAATTLIVLPSRRAVPLPTDL